MSTMPFAPLRSVKLMRIGPTGAGEMSSRGHFATAAQSLEHDCGPCRGLHVRHERVGAVRRSRATLPVPNPNHPIRGTNGDAPAVQFCLVQGGDGLRCVCRAAELHYTHATRVAVVILQYPCCSEGLAVIRTHPVNHKYEHCCIEATRARTKSSDAFVANRAIRVWHGATEHGP